MADKLLDDVKAFLDDIVPDLTNMHVLASQYLNAPTDQKAVDALAKVPAGLIDRAQALSARLTPHDADLRAASKAKPKASAKK